MSQVQDASGATDSTDLNQQLTDLRDGLEKAQKQLKDAEVDISLHEAQIEALSKLIESFDQIVSDYRPEQAGLETSQKACEDYSTNETRCLKEILGQNAERVKDIVGECRSGITRLSDQIKNDEQTLADRKLERDKAEKKRDKSKEAFEAWKKPTTSIKDRLKKLDALRSDIQKAHDSGQYAIAYWLLTDEEKHAGMLKASPQPISAGELRDKLKEAWNTYRTDAEHFQDLDGEVKGREKALETRKTQLSNMQKQLEAMIRLKLAELPPAQSQAA